MTQVPHVVLGDGVTLTLLLLFLMFLLTKGRVELQFFCQPDAGFSLASPGHPTRGVLRCAGDMWTRWQWKAT